MLGFRRNMNPNQFTMEVAHKNKSRRGCMTRWLILVVPHMLPADAPALLADSVINDQVTNIPPQEEEGAASLQESEDIVGDCLANSQVKFLLLSGHSFASAATAHAAASRGQHPQCTTCFERVRRLGSACRSGVWPVAKGCIGFRT